MPIASGAIGKMSILVSPTGGWTPQGDGSGGPRGIRGGVAPIGGWTPNGQRSGFRGVRSPAFNAIGRFITGITKDSTGAALGAVTLDLYDTLTDAKVDQTVSDGSGNYSFGVGLGSYYIVAYKAGAPDLAGTTVNVLIGS